MEKQEIKGVDLEALKSKDSLSEDDIAAIGLSVMEEEKEPKKSEEEVVVEEEKPKEKPKEEEKKPEPTEEEKVKAEEERLLNAKEDDLSQEDKAKKQEVVKKQESSKQKTFDDEVAAYAKESEMSVDEARADLESIGKLQEKYKNDPKQLAKANLHLQRLYTKTQEELKTTKEAVTAKPAIEPTIDAFVKLIEDGKITIKGKAASRDEIIESYRNAEPELTENVDDDTALKLAAKAMREGYLSNQKELVAKMSTDAKEKKSTLIAQLSDEDKQFLPEIKPVLDKYDDKSVLDESFNLKDLVFWAKGKISDAKIKDAEERGYKRGLEEAKILGAKQPGEGAKPPAPKKTVKLSEADKQRALDMYDGLELTDEQKFEAYTEYKETGKK